MPFLKRGGLSLAKHLLHTGSNIVSDVEAGRNLRDSAKERFVESGKGILNKITGGQIGKGRKRKQSIKLKAKTSSKSVAKRARKRKCCIGKHGIALFALYCCFICVLNGY